MFPGPNDSQATQVATVRRPRGRPPSNSYWDPRKGRYVSNATALVTNYHRVWCNVADSNPSPVCPTTYKQATTCPDSSKWKVAIKSELDSLHECKTWAPIHRSQMPPDAVPIRTKWVFKLKRNENNRITRYKARLTACGCAQKHGRDYDETFSPVASAASIRFLFAMAVCCNLFLDQHDVSTAFLYGILPRDQRVYLHPPHGVDLPDDHVLVCLRGIYGLKQSPRLFNQHLSSAIAALKYIQSKSDPCVWFMHDGSDFAIVAIIVDDMLHAATSRRLLYDFSEHLSSIYKMTHLGTPKLMIGIKISFSDTHIALCQQHYIEQLSRKYGQSDSAPVNSPGNPSGCLPGPQRSESEPLDTTTKPYLSLVGSLLWVCVTRPDVQTAVSLACAHSSNPTLAHWRAALRILRYLYHTRSLGLKYPISPRPLRVSAFVDAGYGQDLGHRSRRGHLVMLSQCPIIWTTKATSMVCQSTSEAEFVAANECVKDILWLRGMLEEIGFPPKFPSIVFEDNQATIAMIKNHIVSARNRHFCIRMAWLREQAAANVVKFVYVPSKQNIADIFTKLLPEQQFKHLRDMLLSSIDSSEEVSTGGGVSKHI